MKKLNHYIISDNGNGLIIINEDQQIQEEFVRATDFFIDGTMAISPQPFHQVVVIQFLRRESNRVSDIIYFSSYIFHSAQ